MSPRQEPQQYLKIADFIKEKINSGEWPEGSTLPSEAELCAQFSTSRGPVRQAMSSLRGEGLISSGRGRRSVVLGAFNSEDFESTFSVAHRYRSFNIDIEQQILWLARRPAGPEVAKILRIEPDDPVVYLKRTRSFKDEVRVIQEHYFPLAVGRNILDFDENSGSLHDLLVSRGIEYDHVDRTLEVKFADAEDAKLLGTEPNHPLIQAFHVLSDHNGTPQEYSVFRWRAERMRIQLTTIKGTVSPLRLLLRSNSD